jgi:serpin B
VAPPAAPAGDVRALAAGDVAFAGRLYGSVAGAQKSFALSPLSISQALAMTSAGARGATLAGLRHAVGWPLSEDRLHAAVDTLDAGLRSTATAGIQLQIANSLWGQSGLSFEPPFLDTLARYYGAGMELVDYRNHPDTARVKINRWVAERTHGKIPELLVPGVLASNTRLVLVDAVYLHANWQQPFDRAVTAPGPFHSPDGVRTARFMHRTGMLAYARGTDYQAAELPYKGGRLAMDLIVPARGKLGAVERRLGTGGLDRLWSGLSSRPVTLALPKVKLDSQFELAPTLASLGAGDLFTDRADLSGMTTQERLQISHVVHKVKLTIDEKGTEAAAATGVVGITVSAPAPAATRLTIDRPFLLAVRDRKTGELLFFGRVLSP